MTSERPLLSESDSEYEPAAAHELAAEAAKASKGQFVSRIYLIMLLQITACIVVTLFIRAFEPLRNFFSSGWVIFATLLILSIIVAIIFFAKNFAQKREVTIAIFCVFCLNQELLIGIVAAVLNPGAVLICESMCMTVTLALLIYVSFSKDFRSSIGLPIAIFSTVLSFALFMRITYDTNPLELVSTIQIFCTVFVVLYSVYIVIDVQLLVAGEAYGLTYDHHLIASVYLFLDVFNVIWSFIAMSKDSLG